MKAMAQLYRKGNLDVKINWKFLHPQVNLATYSSGCC
jgi:hypothetical protein